VCWCAVLLEIVTVKVKLYPEVSKSDFWVFFVAKMIKLQQFVISEPDEIYYRSTAAIHCVSITSD